MKKNYFLKGVAAVALGVAAVGCSHDAYVPTPQDVIKDYEAMFVKTFGQPSGNQDWGFGAGTRAADTWDGVHTCFETNWKEKLNFSLPADAVQLDTEDYMYYDEWNHKANVCKIPAGATAIYVSEKFNGEFIFDGNIAGGVSFYNYGTITGFKGGNFTGTTTIYNKGTMTYNVGQQDHNIVNIGTLYVKDNDAYAKILNLYNGGYMEFSGGHTDWSQGGVFVGGEPAQLHSKSHIYSDGEGISMPYGGVIESTCDIHETITVTGDLNIQTDTQKKICGIVASGKVQNTKGRLEVSYIKADDIYFEGNNIYLTPGAHLKANTMEFDKAACDVHAAEGSNALVETTENIHFMNDNDFNRTFSDNIYFKMDGSISMIGQTNGGFTNDDRILYQNADEYIAKHGNPNNKLNSGVATGSPACGDAWSVGTPKEEEWEFERRIFAEDLEARTGSDFDFNDVVFDVYQKSNATKIVLLAAGGTLPLYVAGEEVHAMFGENTTTMINTGAGPELAPVEYEIAKTDYRAIKVAVKRPNIEAPIELTATQGRPAGKFAVSEKIDWQEEFKNINLKYTKFNDWVEGNAEYFYK